MTWRNRARRGGRRAWEFTRSSGARVQRVVSQKAADARQAGARLASKVIGIQQSAGMEDTWKGRRLMQRSAGSVAALRGKDPDSVTAQRNGPEPSAAWQQGYAEVATAALSSHPPYRRALGRTLDAAAVPEAVPGDGPEPAGPERPSWPSGPAMGPEPDGPEAGA